jgi:hypothetical protein
MPKRWHDEGFYKWVCRRHGKKLKTILADKVRDAGATKVFQTDASTDLGHLHGKTHIRVIRPWEAQR